MPPQLSNTNNITPYIFLHIRSVANLLQPLFLSLPFSVSGESLMSRICSSLSGGELFEQITSEGYVMSEAEVINYMRQICEGVKHMHERNIIHLGEEKDEK